MLVNASVPLTVTVFVVLELPKLIDTALLDEKPEKSTVTDDGMLSAVRGVVGDKFEIPRIALPPVATPLPLTVRFPPILPND